jgi:hypothetical protein
MRAVEASLKKIVPRALWNVARGLQTYVPGTNRHWRRTRGTSSAEYCYEVFLKHLLLCREAGMPGVPRSTAEIGPGDSIGVGLAAVILGSARYHALDVVPYSLGDHDRRVLRELLGFLRERRGTPSCGWPSYDHLLDGRRFPSAVLDDRLLEASLAPERLAAIEAALRGEPGEISIRYHCPWTSSDVIEPLSVDWIFSQSVLEHVDDLEGAYASMHRWLKPGGFLSHQVDLRSHELYPEWNGHWGVPAWQWRLVRGRRAYLINRLPYSAHARLVRRFFAVRTELLLAREDGLPEARLRPPFDALTPEERRTAGYFVVAVKR